jgi:hypothetical protein
MQGPTVQTIGLTLAANALKCGLPLKDFWPSSTIFQFCSYVRFVDPRGSGLFRKSYKILADDPAQWLRKAVDRFAGARVNVVPRNDPNIADRASVGFVGGGPRWIIELVGNDFSELWEHRWEVVDQDAPDRRIWGVEYLRISDRWGGMSEPPRDLAQIAAELDQALVEITEFANIHDLGNFAECFERGHSALRSDEPFAAAYHSDLIRAVCSSDRRSSCLLLHKLRGCSAAWGRGTTCGSNTMEPDMRN